MGDTDREAFDSWLTAYGRAWEARDPQAAADLFSEDATYRETPFDEPARGREAIAEYWSRVTAGHDGVRFGYEILAVADDTGIARWWASFQSIRSGKPVELDGIFVVLMDADGRCKKFREWWHYRERDVERG
jgi:uncharacterized protein (TIGR02246 family)